MMRLLPLLLSACYLPTTYGLRDDGLLPLGAEVTAQGVQTGMFAHNGPTPWYGAQGRFRLGPKVGLRMNASALPVAAGDETSVLFWNGEADVLFALAREPEQPVTATLSLGASALLIGAGPDDGLRA